jgi:hypothetical protein
MEACTSYGSMHEAQLQASFLRHLCETGNLPALLQLQQTSKQLQAAVAQILRGQRQLRVAFSTLKDQQLHALVQWLLQHAGLVTSLQLQVNPCSIAGSFMERGPVRRFATGVHDFIGTAAQRAVSSLLAAEDSIPLQSLTLRGTAASRSLLQQLPAAHLTELHAEVDFGYSNSMQALAALSRLRCLTIEQAEQGMGDRNAARAADALAPLAAGLQQLTELHINPVTPAQLQLLPPKLQQLHITGQMYSLQQVLQLADWVDRKGSVLCSLKFHWFCSPSGAEHDSALTALAAAFAAVAEAPAKPAAAATAPAPAAGNGVQLASLSVEGLSCTSAPVAPLLMALPASSLTHLEFNISWTSEADVRALCSLTALKRLQLQGTRDLFSLMRHTARVARSGLQRAQRAGWTAACRPPPNTMPKKLGVRAIDAVDHSVAGQSDSVLVQLSALQQLTRLELLYVRREQLQHLQLPRLQHLDVLVVDSMAGVPLLLGHMTALTALAVEDAGSWSPADQLPPNLISLKLVLGGIKDKGRSSSTASQNSCDDSSISLQPVLGLGQLQKLHLDMECEDGAVQAGEIAQLSTLRSLQQVRIVWDSFKLESNATLEGMAAAFALLPLKALTWRHAGMSAAVMQQLGCLQGLTSLELVGRENMLGSQERVTPAQLAVAVRQLEALQYLHLSGCDYGGVEDTAAADDFDGVVELVQAVDGLKHLFAVSVDLAVQLKGASVNQLQPAAVQQLSPNLLARGCTVLVWRGMPHMTRVGIVSRADVNPAWF